MSAIKSLKSLTERSPAAGSGTGDAGECTRVLDQNGAWHCITCSDEGVPMRVDQIVGDGIAYCSDGGDNEIEVLTGLVSDVAVGHYLLVHAGTALARLQEGAVE